MLESCLRLKQECSWSPGIKQDYEIVTEEKIAVGKLSITRFSVEKPFVSRWLYLNGIEITDPRNRGQGLAYRAMLEVNKLIMDEKVNGVLKNSIMDKNKKDFYQKLGWRKIDGVGGPWEFMMTQPMSVFLIRNIVDEVIRTNFVK